MLSRPPIKASAKLQNYQAKGFTLLEILIALFIFTVLSMILVAALRNIIDTEARAEVKADQLRQLQMATLIMSRDIEQIVSRPILNTSAKEEAAFIGTNESMIFTRTGVGNPKIGKSILQRVKLFLDNGAIWRSSSATLDITAESKPILRKLMSGISDLKIEYYDKDNRLETNWPNVAPSATHITQPLPRAVRISFAVQPWGTISQLYIISTDANETSTIAQK